MNKDLNENVFRRRLSVDFMMYTDNDLEFKRELIDHMIDNLHELCQSYSVCVDLNNIGDFDKVCHKVKTTLVMLADDELNTFLDELKIEPPTMVGNERLKGICGEIIDSLFCEKSNPSIS